MKKRKSNQKELTEAEGLICKSHHPFSMPEEIIEAVIQGKLVIFAGAGISTENRNVFRYSLYKDILDDLGIEKRQNISFSNLMSEFCKQPNGRSKLLQMIKNRFDYVNSFPELYRTATTFHRELSTIYQVNEIITTNWDDYFEKECGAIPIVNPEDFAFWDYPDRKVFKIHGSINNYGSIVATEEDYKKCYKNLSSGLIGSSLKMVLATKVVLFLGYSFGDEDFNKIYNLLRKEMKGILPHAYIITLDKHLKEKFSKLNITPIITDATYFISIIKKHLIKDKLVLDDERCDGLYKALFLINSAHEKLYKYLNYTKNPEIIFTACYQDGLIHAFERAIAKKNTGYYSNPFNIFNAIQSYEKIRKDKVRKKNYLDVAYSDGYIAGLFYIVADNKERKNLPLFYVFGANKDIKTFKEYLKEIKSGNIYHKSAYKFAKKTTEQIDSKDLTLHHSPFL
jgi:NAD-dependent SIR2 family protein deacetylase